VKEIAERLDGLSQRRGPDTV